MSLDTKNVPKKARRHHRNMKSHEAWERSKHERNVAAGPQGYEVEEIGPTPFDLKHIRRRPSGRIERGV